jgi:hypothetical protein
MGLFSKFLNSAAASTITHFDVHINAQSSPEKKHAPLCLSQQSLAKQFLNQKTLNIRNVNTKNTTLKNRRILQVISVVNTRHPATPDSAKYHWLTDKNAP